VRFTLRYVPRFAGLWLFVCILTLVVFALTAYLGLASSLGEAGRSRLLIVLSIQTVCVILGMVALAIFTTHRLAGPIIALQRAFEDVKAGNLDRQLRFRQSDRHLADVEMAFNEMVVSVRERVDGGHAPGRVAGGESA
jgi:nitrogen fixation/metabolism regulation signal transduction histidine kinase